jgi:hypothetical protein
MPLACVSFAFSFNVRWPIMQLMYSGFANQSLASLCILAARQIAAQVHAEIQMLQLAKAAVLGTDG